MINAGYSRTRQAAEQRQKKKKNIYNIYIEKGKRESGKREQKRERCTIGKMNAVARGGASKQHLKRKCHLESTTTQKKKGNKTPVGKAAPPLHPRKSHSVTNTLHSAAVQG